MSEAPYARSIAHAGPPYPHADFVLHPRRVPFRMRGWVKRIAILVAREFMPVRSPQHKQDLIRLIRADLESCTVDADVRIRTEGSNVTYKQLPLLLRNDGDLDVFEEMGGAYPGDAFSNVLYENPGMGDNWMTVQLVGRQSNRSAIGARIRVQIEENGVT